MAALLRKQLLLVIGAAPAFVIVVAMLSNATLLFSRVTLPSNDVAARLGFCVHWLLLPGLTLWAGIQYAGRRGWLPAAIEGTRETGIHSFEINLRYKPTQSSRWLSRRLRGTVSPSLCRTTNSF